MKAFQITWAMMENIELLVRRRVDTFSLSRSRLHLAEQTPYGRITRRQRVLRNASIISLGEVDRLHIDIKLTFDLRVRWIQGVLLWSDGKPVSKDGWVLLSKLEDSEDKNNVRYDLVQVDKQGKFALPVFENAHYWLTSGRDTFDVEFRGVRGGLSNRGITTLRSKPIKIDGSQTTSPLKIVIELPEGATSPQP